MRDSCPVRVAVLVDTSTAWGRRLIRAVLDYARVHGPWDIWLEPRGQAETLRLPKGWAGQGVIARVASQAMADHLLELGLPVVNVSGIRLPSVDFPRVCTDNESYARIAVNHFVDRGIHNVAYIGLHARAYSLARQQAMERACEEAGCRFDVYRQANSPKSDKPWERKRANIGVWLEQLPKPVGVMAWATRLGSVVIEEAIHKKLRVPEDISVLGDDDSLLCEAVQPPLSGVVVPSEQIGLQACGMLDNLMQGKKPSNTEIFLEPTGIVARTSTDVIAVEDEDVAEAIRLIRNRPSEQLRVQDVVDHVAIGRRSLERRFQETLNRTIGEEISRVHLEHAKLLLVTTDLQLPAVAKASGFGSPEYLATVIRRDTGMSPRQYRKRHRAR